MKLYEKHGMRNYCPGLTSGLKAMSLLMMTFVFMTFGSAAQAQLFHGASIQKQCITNVRNCLDDADCSNDDDNLCTPEVCDTDLAPRTLNCAIRATNADDLGDTVSVTAAFDQILTGVGVVRRPVGTGNLLVSAVGGSTDCVVGDPLPCSLLTIDSFVQFNIQYTLLETDNDLAVLLDQATVTWNDNCDDPDTSNCNDVDNTVQAPASTTVLDACSTGEETDCDDSNACTDDSCDPATGECVNVDNYDCDDFNVCTDDFCDPDTGLCVSVPNGLSCEPVPTLSVGGLVAMILTMLALGGILIRRGLLRKATRF